MQIVFGRWLLPRLLALFTAPTMLYIKG